MQGAKTASMHANIVSACADTGIKSLLSDKSYLKDVSYVVLPVGIAADEQVVFSTCTSDARWVPGHVKSGGRSSVLLPIQRT